MGKPQKLKKPQKVIKIILSKIETPYQKDHKLIVRGEGGRGGGRAFLETSSAVYSSRVAYISSFSTNIYISPAKKLLFYIEIRKNEKKFRVHLGPAHLI